MKTTYVAAALAVAAIVFGYLLLQEGDADMTGKMADLTGNWVRAEGEACAGRYPSKIAFSEGGNYAAPTGPEEGAFWHGGEWTLVGEELTVQMANDAMARYRILETSEDAFAVEDADGCRIAYRRA